MVIRQELDWLVSEYGFTAEENTTEVVESAGVDYVSPQVTISPNWNERDGFNIGIHVHVDTYWIRPASSHYFSIRELLRLVTPAVPYETPLSLSRAYEVPTESDLRHMLAFCARQLRSHAEPLLKGDVSICEDLLITRYCETTKGIPLDEYFKVFREECAGLSAVDREGLEAVLSTRSPRPVYSYLHEFVTSRKLHTKRLLGTLQDFWLQYFQ